MKSLRRFIFSFGFVFLLGFVGLTAVSSPVLADCPAGEGECPGGGCAPLGSVCCGNHRYCHSGEICIDNGYKCLRRDDPRNCGGGRYCDPGYICIKGGKCLSTSSPRYCGGREYCNAGYSCIGHRCVAQNQSGGLPGFSGGSGDGGDISDSCLKVGEPREIHGMFGECTEKDGTKSHYYMTKVESTGDIGCPSSIEFEYWDSGDETTDSWFTPFDVQICGSGPIGVHVK